ncbi:hypothetical protein TI05_08840 [Achromatium sp. WMS3]|nr:hypothetical protein TI05_08840 [Achromatium sp. WMS3]
MYSFNAAVTKTLNKANEAKAELIAWRHLGLIFVWATVGALILMAANSISGYKAWYALSIVILMILYLWFYQKTLKPLAMVLGMHTIAGFGFSALPLFEILGTKDIILSGYLIGWILLIGQYILRHRTAQVAIAIGLFRISIGLPILFEFLFRLLESNPLAFREASSLGGMIIGCLVAIVYLGQYIWRHRQTMNSLAMVCNLFNIGLPIALSLVILFNEFKISLGNEELSNITGVMLGSVIGLLLLVQYLWRNRHSIDHLSVVWGLFGIGFWLSLMLMAFFVIFEVHIWLQPHLGHMEAIAIGGILTALPISIHLLWHRSSINFIPMTIGLSGTGMWLSFGLGLWTKIPVFYLILILIPFLAWLRIFYLAEAR